MSHTDGKKITLDLGRMIADIWEKEAPLMAEREQHERDQLLRTTKRFFASQIGKVLPTHDPQKLKAVILRNLRPVPNSTLPMVIIHFTLSGQVLLKVLTQELTDKAEFLKEVATVMDEVLRARLCDLSQFGLKGEYHLMAFSEPRSMTAKNGLWERITDEWSNILDSAFENPKKRFWIARFVIAPTRM